MTELNDFFNDGFGWQCRQCSIELNPDTVLTSGLPRYYREGEAESRSPMLENAALAKWTDKTRRFLTCPQCGITEAVEIN